MGAALEEAAELRASIYYGGDAVFCSIVLLSKRGHCKNREDQGQGFDVACHGLSKYSVE
jgi:hypothetical protein